MFSTRLAFTCISFLLCSISTFTVWYELSVDGEFISSRQEQAVSSTTLTEKVEAVQNAQEISYSVVEVTEAEMEVTKTTTELFAQVVFERAIMESDMEAFSAAILTTVTGAMSSKNDVHFWKLN